MISDLVPNLYAMQETVVVNLRKQNEKLGKMGNREKDRKRMKLLCYVLLRSL